MKDKNKSHDYNKISTIPLICLLNKNILTKFE